MQALRHNVELMPSNCVAHCVSLAPHGATTMAPPVVSCYVAKQAPIPQSTASVAPVIAEA
jgi:D-serine deaminase-like pyridoxal phosphate-dependent protein